MNKNYSINIKILSPQHLFEYVLLESILKKKNVEEKYREHFNNFGFQERSKIFAHVRSKYNFVINLLDDLYTFKRMHYQKVHAKIWTEKQNKGGRYVFHKINFVFTYLVNMLVSGWEQINTKLTTEPKDRTAPQQLRTLLHKKAAIKNL